MPDTSDTSATSVARRRTDLGRRGEDLAVAHLEAEGWRILDRNWRCRWGELDVVAAEPTDTGEIVVFCEVKTRAGTGWGHPLEAITAAKQARLRRLSGCWLAEHRVGVAGVRLDAIGVVVRRGWAPHVEHVRGWQA